MDTREYISARSGLRNYIDNEFDIMNEQSLLPRFNITSANLLHLLPGMTVEKHENFFREILFHQKLSLIEQDFHNITEYVSAENLDRQMLRMLKEQPSIMCTFHSGSYRALNTFLLKNQIPYCLVVAGNISREQGDSYRKGFDLLYDGYIFPEFRLIDAELPTAGLIMLRELRKGRSLLVYVDGNTGTIKNDHSKSEIIPLLNGNLFVKTGISFIAHTAGVPVIPIVCYRTSLDDIRLRFFDPLVTLSGETRKAFVTRATRLLYNGFESILVHYPEQWEAWLYLNQFIVLNETGNMAPISHNRYGFFRIQNDFYLFDKLNYGSYTINLVDYAQLNNNGTPIISFNNIPYLLEMVKK